MKKIIRFKLVYSSLSSKNGGLRQEYIATVLRYRIRIGSKYFLPKKLSKKKLIFLKAYKKHWRTDTPGRRLNKNDWGTDDLLCNLWIQIEKSYPDFRRDAANVKIKKRLTGHEYHPLIKLLNNKSNIFELEFKELLIN